jgi:integrase
VKGRKTAKRWEKTRLQNLVRNAQSGRYYARVFEGGKEVWKSLKTSHFGVAEAKLAVFLAEHREHRGKAEALLAGKMTFGDVLAAHTQHIDDDVQAGRTKKTTAHYWEQVFKALLKSWPELAGRDVRRVTESECKSWAKRFIKTSSPTRFNNTAAGLRHVFEVAIEAGVIHSNPATKLERVPVRAKQLTLPSASEFIELVRVIRLAGAWCSKDCGDFVEGLAVTGARLRDAGEIEWRDVDFEKGEIVIRGDPQTATKKWEIYRVPMIRQARSLFSRMRAERQDEPLSSKVFRVREAQKAIDGACKKLKLARITHHDLRHFFAKVCIESGVDIPTVSRWLNHKDGGALAMKTYGHLGREHSLAQAQKVTFDPVPAMESKNIPTDATAS